MPSDLRNVLLKLSRREDLTRDETRDAFLQLMSGEASEAQTGALLLGLSAKGPTVDELAGAAWVLRDKALTIDAARYPVLLDTCGTGGAAAKTFNISTAAALVAASCGVKVVKHGNRAATSKSGSADVLEQLGVNLDASPAALNKCLDIAGICFAFARAHHPAMKHVAMTRQALGIPTIFNLLGPLSNPARAQHQLIGVNAQSLTETFANVLKELGSKRAWVVAADDGLDEFSTAAPTRITELKDGRVSTFKLDPRDFGLTPATPESLKVQSPQESAEILKSVFAGKKGPHRDIVLLNAAAAMVVAGPAANVGSGINMCAYAIDAGRTRETLANLVACSNAN